MGIRVKPERQVILERPRQLKLITLIGSSIYSINHYHALEDLCSKQLVHNVPVNILINMQLINMHQKTRDRLSCDANLTVAQHSATSVDVFCSLSSSLSLSLTRTYTLSFSRRNFSQVEVEVERKPKLGSTFSNARHEYVPKGEFTPRQKIRKQKGRSQPELTLVKKNRNCRLPSDHQREF